MTTEVESIAAKLGARGGKATVKKRGKKWMRSISRKGVLARKKKSVKE